MTRKDFKAWALGYTRFRVRQPEKTTPFALYSSALNYGKEQQGTVYVDGYHWRRGFECFWANVVWADTETIDCKGK